MRRKIFPNENIYKNSQLADLSTTLEVAFCRFPTSEIPKVVNNDNRTVSFALRETIFKAKLGAYAYDRLVEAHYMFVFTPRDMFH